MTARKLVLIHNFSGKKYKKPAQSVIDQTTERLNITAKSRREKGWIQSTPISEMIAENKRRQAKISALAKGGEGAKTTCRNEFDEILRPKGSCDETYKYRTITGDCNNLQLSSRGAAGIAMRRLAPTAYEDGEANLVSKI